MLKVDTIEKGTVIDHISPGMGKLVLDLLGIDCKYGHRVALVMFVSSKKMGKKDIVKIEDKIVSEKDSDLISLVAPNATINIVKNGKVVEKRRVSLPDLLIGVGTCPNPNCISNHDSAAQTKFIHEGDKYRCFYCERLFLSNELIKKK